ncbi:MAG: NADH-quinone oxidoreductase subunit NuoG, partial [Pseudomonas sp.]
EIRRIENRFNGSVNHYFLCDRGRFGYGYVNNSDRPRQPQLADGTQLSLDAALDKAAALLKGRRVIGIGSPRASLEGNFALRELVGAGNFSVGIAANELACLQQARELLQNGPLPTPTLREIEDHDAVFVLGEDLTQTSARVALALRQAVKGKATDIAASMKIQDWHMAAVQNVAQHASNPLFIATVDATRLDDAATETVHAAPADLARLGFAVAHAIDPNAPAVSGLDSEAEQLAQRIAAALLAGKRPLIVAGTSLGNQALLEAAGNIAQALKNREKNASISLALGEANSLGATLLGGDSLESALARLQSGEADALVVLENDLYRRADKAVVDATLAKASVLIVADHQPTATVSRADLVLPVATFAEGDGTLVSQEGRAQRFFQVFDPVYYNADNLVREGWRWLHALHSTLQGQSVDWTQLDQVTNACAASSELLAGIRDAAPSASFRIKGLKLAREPHRYSGRTSMRANISVHEPRQPQDKDSAFAFSMEGYAGSAEDRQQIPFAWSPGWNSPQAWNKFQDEVGGHLRAGDPGVRLLDGERADLNWFSVPAPCSAQPGNWQVVPYFHLFGSDETSARAKPIQQRIPEAYVVLAEEDAAKLGVNPGAMLGLTVGGVTLRLPLQTSAALSSGLIGLPAGLPGIPALTANVSVSDVQEVA